MTDILTEQNFICNDNALVINDLQRLVLEFLMEEGGGGERRLQTLIQKLLQKLCWTNYFSLRLRHSPQQPKNPKPTSPPCAVTHYNQLLFNTSFLSPPPPYRGHGFYSLRIHLWKILSLRLATNAVQISSIL